ncbi:hypothetical protein [Marinobacter sp. MDS2]|uniref:hypothetical protein n=1 Tax=Marinobacter sp. MDS2 TaxID=3065961 RepID=UPI00273BD0E1|nr:hypothetical protein [Marinobacter sp. MDS2]MDP4546488.1 hypothetical protein [Marinobacter sp. MDS2]
MDTTTLIDKIAKARTKDDLEALGIEHLGIDVDKRETKDALRAKLLLLAEQRQTENLDEPEPDVAGEAIADAAPEADPEPQAPAPQVAEPAPSTGYKGKLGRNKRTGRTLPWTPDMAKYSHMEEVG